MGTLAWHPRLTHLGSCRVLSACPPEFAADRHRLTAAMRDRLWERARGALPVGGALHPMSSCDTDCVEPHHQRPMRLGPDTSIRSVRARKRWPRLSARERYKRRPLTAGHGVCTEGTLPCRRCDKPFARAGLTGTVRYCSPRCRRLAYNARMRDLKARQRAAVLGGVSA